MAIRIGQEGIFRIDVNDYYEATAMVKPRAELPALSSSVHFKIPRIPYTKLQEIIEQMRYVAEHRNAELYIAIYYSHEDRQYLFVIPDQEPYGPENTLLDIGPLPPSPPGYNLLGDIHSHKDGQAGHSIWDDADEYGMPGIHITIGNLITSVFPSISCSVMVDDRRVFFQPEQLFAPPPVKESVELERLTKLKLPLKRKVGRLLDQILVFLPKRRR